MDRPSSALFPAGNILDAAAAHNPLTPLQAQTQDLVSTFVEKATDGPSLAALMAGGIAYRVGRIGAMGFHIGSSGRASLQVASIGLGLTAEVSAFELVHRGLTSLPVGARSGHPQFVSKGTGEETSPLHSENPNLWRWSGPGGLRQGLFHSLITFGTLKGAGRLAQGQNLIARHLFQDTAMVMGHQTAGVLGLGTRPTGTLAEQFLNAEAMNLQMSAGAALGHRLAPGMNGLERRFDVSLNFLDVVAGPRARPLPEGSHRGLPLQTAAVIPNRLHADRFRPLFPAAFAMSRGPGNAPRPLQVAEVQTAVRKGLDKEVRRRMKIRLPIFNADLELTIHRESGRVLDPIADSLPSETDHRWMKVQFRLDERGEADLPVHERDRLRLQLSGNRPSPEMRVVMEGLLRFKDPLVSEEQSRALASIYTTPTHILPATGIHTAPTHILPKAAAAEPEPKAPLPAATEYALMFFETLEYRTALALREESAFKLLNRAERKEVVDYLKAMENNRPTEPPAWFQSIRYEGRIAGGEDAVVFPDLPHNRSRPHTVKMIVLGKENEGTVLSLQTAPENRPVYSTRFRSLQGPLPFATGESVYVLLK